MYFLIIPALCNAEVKRPQSVWDITGAAAEIYSVKGRREPSRQRGRETREDALRKTLSAPPSFKKAQIKNLEQAYSNIT
jgi:hypothetical protein